MKQYILTGESAKKFMEIKSHNEEKLKERIGMDKKVEYVVSAFNGRRTEKFSNVEDANKCFEYLVSELEDTHIVMRKVEYSIIKDKYVN